MSLIREVRARNEAEAEGAAKSGLETVVQVLQKPIMLTREAYTVCQRSNRHLIEAEAEAEKGQCSRDTTIDTTIANVVTDGMNIQAEWNNVRHVGKDTREEAEIACSCATIIQM